MDVQFSIDPGEEGAGAVEELRFQGKLIRFRTDYNLCEPGPSPPKLSVNFRGLSIARYATELYQFWHPRNDDP